MTKAELIAALANIPDDAKVLIRAVAETNNFAAMVEQAKADQMDGQYPTAELSTITGLSPSEEGSPFVVIEHFLEYNR